MEMEWPRLNHPWLLLLCATILVLGCGSKACIQEEKTALLNYKEFLKSHKKSVNSSLRSWVHDPESDCCEWERVTCDSASGRVIHLSLHLLYGASPHADWFFPYRFRCIDFLSLNFSMFLPFKELRSLDLSFNCFDDWVSTQDYGGTSALKMLETLDLSNCGFNLSIMETLSAFTSLRTLLLANNGMDGPFPIQELLALQNLELLDLSGNYLRHWTTPDFKSMSSLKKLETLDLSDNVFPETSASIFETLSALKSLKKLFLRSNDIIGPLAVHELSVLQNLELLDLSYNLLTSPSTTKDSSALTRLKKLRTLDLSGNDFGKRTFKFLSALPALKSLILYNNWSMKGKLDDKVFANLSNLEVLILGQSAGPLLTIQGLCKMKNLQELDLSSNDLIGTLHSFSCLENLTSLRALDLSSNYLSGNISSSFVARLASSLEYLSLSENNFEGTFPLSSLANYSELKVLKLGKMDNKNFQVETENPPWIPSFQLQYLTMADCQVNLPIRTIPTFLSYQRGLRYIDLSNNNLVGRFPNWLLVNNPKLECMFLNDNSFNGSFLLPSDEDQHMDHLYILHIAHNKIQDKLPKTIGFFFPQLLYLNASSNVLDGDIPASIGELSDLMTLDLAYNNFSGELPNDMFMGCFSLKILRLSHNRFQGQILPAPLNTRNLRLLIMDNNQFDGTLQDGLLSIDYLGALDISNNKLSGELPGWIGNLHHLKFLGVSWNNFEGAIPKELCKLELIFVSLSHNRFSGAMPSCLGSMSSLHFIHLQKNSLTGTIPEAVLRSSELVSLDLGDNNISGSIPKSVNGLANLMFLSLAGNRLQGQLPRQICELKALSFLDLSRNNFTGSIPTCFNNISFGNESYYNFLFNYFRYSFFGFVSDDLFYIDYQYPHFDLNMLDKSAAYYAPEEMQFTTKGLTLSYKGNILNYMSGLDLSVNQLAGQIPQQIGDLIALHALNLSHNYLNGSIPGSFHKLKEIESLDLSFNKLSGPIPLQLQDLNYLSIFNVSFNNLSGRAPDKGQFATFDESSYRGNPDLSWNISNRGIATPPPPATLNDGENNSAIDFISFCGSFAASYVMVLLMFMGILWINPHWRRAWFYFIEDCLYKCFGQVLKDAFY